MTRHNTISEIMKLNIDRLHLIESHHTILQQRHRQQLNISTACRMPVPAPAGARAGTGRSPCRHRQEPVPAPAGARAGTGRSPCRQQRQGGHRHIASPFTTPPNEHTGQKSHCVTTHRAIGKHAVLFEKNLKKKWAPARRPTLGRPIGRAPPSAAPVSGPCGGRTMLGPTACGT
jgi:hypothetical protein